MSVVSMKKLLEAGVHFGHQTRRWNPKMKKFIFTERNGIYIIDLQKTVEQIEKAYDFLREVASEGGSVLFVGTKKQAKDSIKLEAQRSGQYYVSNRWLGGMLTNFQTIRKSVDKLKKLEAMEEDGTFDLLPKREVLEHKREMEKLEKNLGGIKEMTQLPDALFVVDPKNEELAVHEAQILGIPVVSIIDTNADPDEVTIPIPGNDDAIRAVKLIANIMSKAIIEGKQGLENFDENEVDFESSDEDIEEFDEEEVDEENFDDIDYIEDESEE